MVRTIEVPADKIRVNGNQIEVDAQVGEGTIVGATLKIQDSTPASQETDPRTMSIEEWERNLEEIIKSAPLNKYPCDDSREAIYGPDPGEEDNE